MEEYIGIPILFEVPFLVARVDENINEITLREGQVRRDAGRIEHFFILDFAEQLRSDAETGEQRRRSERDAPPVPADARIYQGRLHTVRVEWLAIVVLPFRGTDRLMSPEHKDVREELDGERVYWRRDWGKAA
jgi:hypothetical protein